MSTTFGVKIPSTNKVIEVAFRSREIRFTNSIAELLPDSTEVIAMDNTPQGIYTILDIKDEIFEQNNTKKMTTKPGFVEKRMKLAEEDEINKAAEEWEYVDGIYGFKKGVEWYKKRIEMLNKSKNNKNDKETK